jgi:hypothetical protein
VETPAKHICGAGRSLALLEPFAWLILVTFGLCGHARAAEQRTLYITVLSKSGKAGVGLGAENFRGEFSGKAVKIISATPENGWGRILLLMDVGPRMKQGTKWERAWAGAQDIVKMLADKHPAAIFTIGERVLGSSTFQADSAKLSSILTETEGSSRAGQAPAVTPMVQAISILLAQPALLRRGDLLFLITEAPLANDPFMSEEKVRAVGNELSMHGVRLFKLTFFEDVPFAETLYHWSQFQLDDAVVRACGGLDFAFHPRKSTPQELRGQMKWVYEAVKGSYQLEVEFPLTIEKPREWKLRVFDGSGRKFQDEEVHYPHLVVPSSGQNP